MAEGQTLIQGTRMRLTLIDGCGAAVNGACSTITTSGFISVAMTDNVEAGDEFKVKQANGQFCVNQRSRPQLNWIDTKISLCQVQPETFSMLTGAPIIYDDSLPTPKAVGFGTDEDTYATASFALEVWTDVAKANNSACAGGVGRFGYVLLPWLVEGSAGDVTIENGPVNFELSARTSGGNDWGYGSYNTVLNRFGSPAKLAQPVPSRRHRQIMLTSLAPPAAVLGCQALAAAS